MTNTLNVLDVLAAELVVCTRTNACKWICAGHVYIDGRLVRDRRQRFDVNEITEIKIRGETVWERTYKTS